MMRTVILAVTILAGGLCPTFAVNMASNTLRLGYFYTFQFGNNDATRHIVYRTDIPSGVIAIIGVRRLEGIGNLDLEIGDDVSEGSNRRAQLSGVVSSSSHSNGNLPDIVTTPPGSAKTYYLHAYEADGAAGKWEMQIRHFDVLGEFFQAFAAAALQRGFECLFLDCSSNEPPSPSEEWVGRALGLGISAFQSGTVCSFGVRSIANEVQVQVSREYPDSRFLQYGIINFISSLGGAYADVSCPR